MALEYLSHLARLDASDIHPGGSRASAALLAALDAEPCLRVLEFGCGTATTLERICGEPTVSAAGLDLLPEMLARARRRLLSAGIDDRVILVRGSAERMPFATGSFDAVYCESVLGFQKTAALRMMLRECCRVLRPGGRLLANEAIWKPDVDDDLAETINSACEKDFGLPQATETAWSLADWLRELRDAGFQVDHHALLSDLAAETASTGIRRSNPDAGMAIRRAITRLSPAVLAERLRYRRLVKSYRPVSVHVEGRLFIATRHSTGG